VESPIEGKEGGYVMELSRFLLSTRRHFLVPVTLLAVGLFGSFLYLYATPQFEAESTVAVLDPLVAHPAYGAAQITFDEVVKSERLHERVANRIQKSPDYVSNRLSVALVPALSPLDPSPLFAVRGKAESQKDALRLTNVAVEESIALYTELNAPNLDAIQGAVSSEEVGAQKDLDQARAAITKFENDNNAPDYPLLLARESAVVSVLEGSQDSYLINKSIIDYAANYSIQAYVEQILLDKAHSTFSDILAKHEAELTRLQKLENRYSQLSYDVESAQTRLTQVKLAEQSQVIGQLIPQESQVKILDKAKATSTLITKLLVYAVGGFLGLLLGLGVVYGVALIEKPPVTPASLAGIFGAPILVRIPRAPEPVRATNGNGSNGNGHHS
jgi:uncharacterized protein involved in exopolysaccharide biosynthesis